MLRRLSLITFYCELLYHTLLELIDFRDHGFNLLLGQGQQS